MKRGFYAAAVEKAEEYIGVPKKRSFLGKRSGNEATTVRRLRHTVKAQFAATKTDGFFAHRKGAVIEFAVALKPSPSGEGVTALP